MSCGFQCFFLLAVFAIFRGGYSAPADNVIEIDFHRIIYEANAKDLLTNFLPQIRDSAIHYGLDPIELESFSAGILPLPGVLEGNINFKNGWLQGFGQVQRVRKAVATYSDKRLVVDIILGWDDLEFTYEYDFRYLLVSRRGDVIGHFKNIDIRVVITLDLLDYTVFLDILEFASVEKYKLRLEGHLADPLFNAAAKVVTTLFKDRAVRMIEKRALILTRQTFDKLNAKIPRPSNKAINLFRSEQYLL